MTNIAPCAPQEEGVFALLKKELQSSIGQCVYIFRTAKPGDQHSVRYAYAYMEHSVRNTYSALQNRGISIACDMHMHIWSTACETKYSPQKPQKLALSRGSKDTARQEAHKKAGAHLILSTQTHYIHAVRTAMSVMRPKDAKQTTRCADCDAVMHNPVSRSKGSRATYWWHCSVVLACPT